MDGITAGGALVIASVVGLVAVAIIALRQRQEEALAARSARESPFAASTEGSRVCPRCAGDNLWTEGRCIHCGAALS